MTDLPQGWEWTTLGEVATTSLGKMLDKKRATGLHPTPYLRNINVRWNAFDLGDLAVMDIHPDELDRVLALPGDVVVCEGGEPGRAAVWTGSGPIAIQKALHRVRPLGPIDPRYLVHLLLDLSLSGKLARRFTGTTIKHLPQERLRAVTFPIAPASEQKRIVVAIEEYLSRLDAAKASLASAAARVSLQARSALSAAEAGPWPRVALGEVLTSLRNGIFVSRPKLEPPGLKIFRISAVRTLSLDVKDVRFAPRDLDGQDRYKVDTGNLLFTRYSGNPAYVGACAVVPLQGAGTLHPDKLIRGVVDRERALPEWVALAVAAPSGRAEIEQRLKTTAGQVGIAGGQLQQIQIPLPPLDVQRQRVADWTAGSEGGRRLAAQIEGWQRRSVGLHRSILAAAFSGKLVPQDPADEPASTLLARIRAEREASAPVKRRRAKVSS